MNSLHRVSRLLLLLIVLALPVRAQDDSFGLGADDYALFLSATTATLGSGHYGYSYELQADLDGLRTFAGGLSLKGQGQADHSGKTPSVAFDAAGDVRFGSAFTFPVDFQSRLIGGQLYLNAGGAQSPAWQVMPSDAVRLSFSGGLIDSPTQAVDLSFSADDNDAVPGFAGLFADLAALKPATFTAMKRLPDAGGLADFQIALDAPKLVATPELIALMRNFVMTEGISQVVFDDAKWQTVSGQLAAFFADTTLTADVYVDPTAKVIRRVVVDGRSVADPAALELTDGPITLTLHLDVTFDADLPAIETPADAQTVEALTVPLGDGVPALQPDAAEQLLMRVSVVDDGGSTALPLDLKAGQTVTIAARVLTFNADPVITLLAPDGSALADNDDHESADYLLTYPDSEIKDLKIPADGTYQLKVEQLEGSSGALLISVYVKN